MKISDVIDFLEGVKAQDGDLKIQSVTGFWIRQVPSTGEKVVVFAVGDAKALDERAVNAMQGFKS